MKDAHASAQEPTEAPPEQRTAQPADHEAGLGDRGDGVLLAGSPFQGTEALDGTAELGVTYLYRARAVSLAPGVGLRESEATDEQSVDYQDRFAPDPPALVTADAVMEAKPDAAAGQPSLAIRVSWSPPVASDLGGYRIERASGTEAFTAIGSVAASGIAWVDWDVTPGVTYRYRVVALDGASPPNASAPSAEAEAAATIETE